MSALDERVRALIDRIDAIEVHLALATLILFALIMPPQVEFADVRSRRLESAASLFVQFRLEATGTGDECVELSGGETIDEFLDDVIRLKKWFSG